jgi:NADPH-dependent curcumin reductase CurA
MTHAPRFAEAAAGRLLASGKIKRRRYRPAWKPSQKPLLKLFSGENFGKLVLKVE